MGRPGTFTLARWGNFLVGAALVMAFVAYRWSMRLEPLNSDDVTLFWIGDSLFHGDHWLLAGNGVPSDHQRLRLGLLPLLAPAISGLGPTAAAYYIVPLALATLGFWLCWRIALENAGLSIAVAFAVFHIALPFEVRHASLLLVDLPSAVFVVLCLYLVHRLAPADGGTTARGAWGGLLAGLAGFEAYLLRINILVFLAPGLAVLVATRRTRRIAVSASVVIAAGVVLEQLLYLSLGEGFGYRWRMVQQALDHYAHFLPLVEPRDFAGRYFRFVYNSVGGGFAGSFLEGILGFSLLAHVFALVRGAPLMRALAATGLVTFAATVYGVHSWDDAGIRVLGPENYRYLQLFYYTSVVTLALGTRALLNATDLLSRSRRPARAVLAAALVTVAVVPFGITARYVGPRLASPASGIHAMTCAIDEAARANGGTIAVASTPYSSRVARLFRNDRSDPRVEWHLAPIGKVSRLPAAEAPFMFFDHYRLLHSTRYKSGAAYTTYLGNLVRLDTRLWYSYEPLTARSKASFYARSPGPKAPSQPVGWQRLPGRPLGERVARIPVQPGAAPFLLFTGTVGGPGSPPTGDRTARIRPGRIYALRFRLDYPKQMRVTGRLEQNAGARQWWRSGLTVLNSWNTVRFEPEPGARRFRVILRVEPGDLDGPGELSIAHSELRSWPKPAGCP